MDNLKEQYKFDICQAKLDAEFKDILSTIKNCITQINSNYYLEQYRLWLEKLSDPDHSEKNERNQYLRELAKQISTGSLDPPFDQKPPNGSLKEFTMNVLCPRPPPNITQKVSPKWFQSNASNNVVRQPPCSKNQSYSSNNQCSVPNVAPTITKPTIVNKQNIDQNNNLMSVEKRGSFTTNKMNIQNLMNMKEAIEKRFRDRKMNHHLEIIEDSSWCDLTDDNQTMASGDTEFENRNINDDGKNVKLEETKKLGIVGLKDTDGNIYSSVKKEVAPQSEGMRDLNQSSDWNKTVEALQLSLEQTISQNKDLKSTITSLEKDIEQCVFMKNKEKEEIKAKLIELHRNETKNLKKQQIDNIKSLEETFQGKLDEVQSSFEKRLTEIRTNYESQVEKMDNEYQSALRERDKEINRLNNIIRDECARLSEELMALRIAIDDISSCANNEDKIMFLQKCVSKMDKLFQKSERDFVKQIEKLKMDMEFREKAMQIQLKTQKSELLARSNAVKQEEIEAIVNDLEVRYIKMLESQEAQAMESKKQDEQIIEELKEILIKNNIPFNDLY